MTGEVTFFRLDFANQIIPGAQSGGATTTLVNGGETLHQGIEASLRTNWNEVFHAPLLIYSDVRYLRLETAKFTQNSLFQGNRLPYAPKDTFSTLLGIRQARGFGFQVDVSYIGPQFGDNENRDTASADGTVGPLASYVIWNVAADYTIRRERFEVAPYFSVKNLADALYIASRAPQGIQPGMFRQVNGGLRFTF
jgi:Fe(3+) dicitrate transport protein